MIRDGRKPCKSREIVNLLVDDFEPFLVCREHTARVMETVRAINAGKTSKRSRKIGAHPHQSTSAGKDGSGFNFTLSNTAAGTRGGGEGTSGTQEGNPGAGVYPTVIRMPQ